MDTILRTWSEIAYYFEARDFSTCAFDTETTSLKYTELDIVGCSFSNGEDTCYINLWKNLEKGDILSYLHGLFHHKIKSLIMHNAPFDLKVLWKHDIRDVTKNIFCTMTAHHLINENSNHGLKFLAEKYLGEKAISYDEASTCGFDHPMFLQYACNDARWTWDLHKIFNKKLYEFGVNRLFFEVEMPFQFTLMDMAINGILINQEKLETLRVDAGLKRFELKKKLYDMAGLGYSIQADMFAGEPEMVSKHKLGSDTLIRIFKSRGLDSPYLTDGGKMSVGKETLLHLKGDPFVDELYKYNIVDKLMNGFVDKMPHHIEEDGRVRTTFWNTGTKTGRLSSREPNMQQNPKMKKEMPFDFKEIFEAPEGKVIVSADYSGQELRILAIISRDEILIDAFNKGKDLHLMTGLAVAGIEIDEEMMAESHPDYEKIKEKYAYERYIGKNGYNFPIVYGTTAYGISKNNGISENEAQLGIDKFFGAYPGVRSAINRCSRFLKENWHVRSLTRRRRRLDPDKKKSHRQAFNFLIQGLAADMIRCACNNVRKLLLENPHWECKQLLIIHDEIVFEIKEEYAEVAMPKIQEAMETAMDLPLKMVVEMGIGKSYSGAK